MKKIILFLPILICILFLDQYVKYNINKELSKYKSSINIQSKYRYEKINEKLWGNRRYYLNPYKLYQYNEYGYISEVGDIKLKKKTKNEFRIFLFGGSAVTSAEVNRGFEDISGLNAISYEDTIAYKFQKKLNNSKKNKNMTFRVIDAAVTTQTSYQSFEHFKNSIKHEPDLVIFLIGFNDFKVKEDNIEKILKNDFNDQPQNKLFYRTIGFFSEHSGIFYYLIQKFYNRNSSKINYNFDPKTNFLKEEIEKNIKYLSKKNNLSENDKKRVQNIYLRFEKKLIEMSDYFKEKNINFILIKQPMITHKKFENLNLIEKTIYLRWASFQLFEIDYYNKLIKKNYNDKEVENNIYFPEEIVNSKEDTFIDFTHFSENGINQLINYLFQITKNKYLFNELT